MTTYTHGHHESVLRAHRWRTAENSAAYLLRHLQPGMTLLDVGCGPGTITVDLARAVGPGGHVIGIDRAPDVIESARAFAEGQRVTNVSFEVADVYDLDATDETYDVVHAHQVLQHVGDPVGMLRAMHRVTRPSGLIAARDADYAAMTWFPRSEGLEEWVGLYRQVARENGGEPDAGRRLVAWAVDAGLENLTPSASAWCFAMSEDRSFWGELWAERVTTSALGEQLLAASLAEPADLERIAAAWRTWAADERAWFAVLNGEILARRR